MKLARLTPPSVQLVPLAEMKAHLRFELDDELEDTTVTALLKVATETLDGRTGLLGRCLLAQTWLATLDGFPSAIELPLPPTISVDEVSYDAAGGASTILAPSAYRVDGIGSEDGARLQPAIGSAWPALASGGGTVRIRFVAGYGAEAGDVPARLREAVKRLVAHLYQHRGDDGDRGLPAGWSDLVSDFRVAGV